MVENEHQGRLPTKESLNCKHIRMPVVYYKSKDCSLGPPNILQNGSLKIFSWGLNGRNLKLTTHLHQEAR
jgi:hypothetical protein